MITLADKQQQLDFLKTYQAYYDKAAADLGIQPDIVAAQWALESAWGTDTQAVDAHNLGGVMKAAGVMWAFQDFDQFVRVYVNSMHNDCPALQDGQTDHLHLTAEEIFTHDHYNTVNPHYGAEIAAIVASIEALKSPATEPATEPATSASTPQDASAAPDPANVLKELSAILKKAGY